MTNPTEATKLENAHLQKETNIQKKEEYLDTEVFIYDAGP